MLNCSENHQRLIALEEAAKAACKGKWAPREEHDQHVRSVTWSHDNLSHLVDSFHKKPVDGKCQTQWDLEHFVFICYQWLSKPVRV